MLAGIRQIRVMLEIHHVTLVASITLDCSKVNKQAPYKNHIKNLVTFCR